MSKKFGKPRAQWSHKFSNSLVIMDQELGVPPYLSEPVASRMKHRAPNDTAGPATTRDGNVVVTGARV